MPTEIVLENNLVLRSLRGDADKERYAVFNTSFNNPFEGATCACLMYHHPETTLEDYWLVEDPSSGEVVSTTCLLPWICRFDGIDLRVAQLEMVLTHPAYRGRGLARAQINHFEQVALERGFDLSIISGIPYYYRQFGYAYAIDGDRCEALPVWKIPDQPLGVGQPLRLREARSTDIPFLTAGYAGVTDALNIAIQRTSAHWRYMLEAAQHPVEMVVNAQTGETLGYVTMLRNDESITILESGLAEARDCLRLLLNLKTQASRQVRVYGSPYTSLVQLAHSLGSQVAAGTQWLLRFPDLATFLVRIGPVMENRLAGSGWRGLSTELIINLYRQAFRLRFQSGKLAGVDSLGFVDASMGADGGHLCIPPEAFVRLVSGYRTLDALFDAWPDIVVKPEVRNLIDVLFPLLKAYLYTPYHYLGKI